MAFEQRLAELGYQEGGNFAFEFIQIPSFEGYESGFRELVARKVDIIFHGGAELGLKWALKVTTTLPIVIVATDYDLLAHGYVTSLARPSGNITDVFPQQIDLAKRRLQVFKEALPDLHTATSSGTRHRRINGRQQAPRRESLDCGSSALNYANYPMSTKQR